ncbi:glycine decarboxylase, PLP-dependent, subunit (protein P) of glycine cleavage complex [Candidatus Promineifilum breve]|uniref:Glycine dehydrogenase (decarboxylating) n=1 Tax=Candidatus Promineifilum breve TaxID=1806508 RepID=A0A170PIS5_9CHLR|nr:aminomethyl-transferring glycine dehydrogenase [Candidatus Promineifilum breve]CUS05003.2 glycine decarboxylase, PLP-dependent, subunit (protein P) of glycine cleavage complex [Candidatus Promineifilum breve]
MTTPTPRANWQDIIEAHDEERGNGAIHLSNRDLLLPADRFVKRHIGPRSHDVTKMLRTLGLNSLDELIDQAIPDNIRMDGYLALDPPRSESGVLEELRQMAAKNKVYRSFIGMGYHGTITPPVIQRNVLENPGWYTAYTPYQPEISQGRLEALINFQTMVTDLTGLEIANASLLDEATAAAEAMTLCHRAMPRSSTANVFFVSELVHPQTIAVVRTRAEPFGFKVVVGNHEEYDFAEATFGVLLQYPATNGDIHDYRAFAEKAHKAGALVVAATDLLALVLLTPPGEWGADVALGNSQRFGVPMGYGGPHAAFFATKDEYKRIMPGRLVGVTIDATGKKGYRLTLTTREQHIRREKATSNICTAQVLLAVMAAMYAVYHGPVGLRRIATRVRLLTGVLAAGLKQMGYQVNQGAPAVFDTLTVSGGRRSDIELRGAALGHGINLRYYGTTGVGVALDETVTVADLEALLAVFGAQEGEIDIADLADGVNLDYDAPFRRESDFLTHPVFNSYLSETEMMRYLKRLENRDISLVHSMIPLGSCTMKLNAAAEMLSITLPGFAALHPFVPLDQAQGYQELFHNLEAWLTEITGFDSCSLQPNSGAQGEYTGMLTIRAYQIARGQGNRHLCLIPASAHGTNPASAALAGMDVVVVATDDHGNVDVADLRAKAEQHRDKLAALMITYPSTHGVYEAAIGEICKIIHDNGGQVYMDGANMNALVAICRPGDFGPDVLHLNLHKTFSIPHGGGGPGMGPICVAAHLSPYLPGHAVVPGVGGAESLGTVSAAPWGSASILPIPYAYIAMMGEWGLRVATEIAILNANYVAEKLEAHYPVLYRGANGRIAHECIVDPRHLKDTAGVSAEDITKRLMDFGFHAPTLSFPVPGTLMIEPTESESLAELDRFIEAMILIREEIRAIEEGRMDHDNNPLKHAPHTAEVVLAAEWDRPYSREQAAYPADWVRRGKVWPTVSRIDNVYGDRNLFCVCIPIEEYA